LNLEELAIIATHLHKTIKKYKKGEFKDLLIFSLDFLVVFVASVILAKDGLRLLAKLFKQFPVLRDHLEAALFYFTVCHFSTFCGADDTR
jgi:hypothetical protein